jgi:hypothetical protein
MARLEFQDFADFAAPLVAKYSTHRMCPGSDAWYAAEK